MSLDNPFDEMELYSEADLKAMSLLELYAVQRSILFPAEQEIFDRGESVFLEEGDARTTFLDFTDGLIVDIELEK